MSNMILKIAVFVTLVYLCACSEDQQQCAKFKFQDKETAPPSVVKAYFSLSSCDGEPISGVTAEDFVIKEDGRTVEPQMGSQKVIQDQDRIRRTNLVLVDMAGSIAGGQNLGYIQRALLEFSNRILQDHEMALYAFDGREDLIEIADFTTKSGEITSAIETLDAFEVKDSSRNLNGAIIKGLKMLSSREQQFKDALFIGSMVVITDGIDHAGFASDSRAANDAASSKYTVQALGLGGDIDKDFLKAVGKDTASFTTKLDSVGRIMLDMAEEIQTRAGSYYILAYCSLSRAGSHKVTVELKGHGGALEFNFKADSFSGGSCGSKDF